MKRWVLVLLGVTIGALVKLASYDLSPCEAYGGRSAAYYEASCHCRGWLYTAQNDAPLDGQTIRYCIGVMTDRACSMARPGGKPTPVSCPRA